MRVRLVVLPLRYCLMYSFTHSKVDRGPNRGFSTNAKTNTLSLCRRWGVFSLAPMLRGTVPSPVCAVSRAVSLPSLQQWDLAQPATYLHTRAGLAIGCVRLGRTPDQFYALVVAPRRLDYSGSLVLAWGMSAGRRFSGEACGQVRPANTLPRLALARKPLLLSLWPPLMSTQKPPGNMLRFFPKGLTPFGTSGTLRMSVRQAA